MTFNLSMVKPFLQKHGPSILTGLTIFGVAATGYLTHVADKKLIGDVCEKIVMSEDTEKPVKEIVNETAKEHWKDYIAPAAVGLATMGCSFGANSWHLSKEGTLAAAALMYKTSGEELEKKIREKFGDEETAKIKKEIAEAKADKERPPWEEKRPDKMKIWEPYSKQWFYATQQELLWAEIVINKMLAQNYQVSMNDLLKIYNCKPIKDGDNFGWSYDDECFTELWACGGAMMGNWIGFSPGYRQDSNGEWYFEMDYEVHPNDFQKLE